MQTCWEVCRTVVTLVILWWISRTVTTMRGTDWKWLCTLIWACGLCLLTTYHLWEADIRPMCCVETQHISTLFTDLSLHKGFHCTWMTSLPLLFLSIIQPLLLTWLLIWIDWLSQLCFKLYICSPNCLYYECKLMMVGLTASICWSRKLEVFWNIDEMLTCCWLSPWWQAHALSLQDAVVTQWLGALNSTA